MTAIIIPRRHLAQPQGRVAPTPDWPAQALLAYANAGGITDVVQEITYEFPQQFTGGIHLEWMPSPSGLTLAESKSLSAAARQIPIPNLVPQGAQWSISGRLRQTGNDSVYQSGNAAGGGLAPEVGSIQLRVQSGKLQFVRQGVAVILTSSATIPTNRNFSFVLTYNGASARLYVDGRYDSEAAYSYAFQATSANQCLWRNVTGSTLDYFGIFSRELVAAEAFALHENPWQLFRADPVRIYSFPSGPIIPSLSALTTSNITAIGARHSLTLTY